MKNSVQSFVLFFYIPKITKQTLEWIKTQITLVIFETGYWSKLVFQVQRQLKESPPQHIRVLSAALFSLKMIV